MEFRSLGEIEANWVHYGNDEKEQILRQLHNLEPRLFEEIAQESTIDGSPAIRTAPVTRAAPANSSAQSQPQKSKSNLLVPDCLTGIPEDIWDIVREKNPKAFFMTDKEKQHSNILEALWQNSSSHWVNAIRRRFYAVGLCLLVSREKPRRPRRDRNEYKILSNMLKNAEFNRERIPETKMLYEIKTYFQAGKRYLALADDLSWGVLILLSPDYPSFYEDKLPINTKKKRRVDMITCLRKQGAKLASEIEPGSKEAEIQDLAVMIRDWIVKKLDKIMNTPPGSNAENPDHPLPVPRIETGKSKRRRGPNKRSRLTTSTNCLAGRTVSDGGLSMQNLERDCAGPQSRGESTLTAGPDHLGAETGVTNSSVYSDGQAFNSTEAYQMSVIDAMQIPQAFEFVNFRNNNQTDMQMSAIDAMQTAQTYEYLDFRNNNQTDMQMSAIDAMQTAQAYEYLNFLNNNQPNVPVSTIDSRQISQPSNFTGLLNDGMIDTDAAQPSVETPYLQNYRGTTHTGDAPINTAPARQPTFNHLGHRLTFAPVPGGPIQCRS